MKTLIMAAAAVASLGMATSIRAQDMPPPPPPPDYHDHVAGYADSPWPLERREEWMQGRIDRASEHGRLSGAEEQRGRAELDAIRGEHQRLIERDGGRLTDPDRLYVAQRIDELNRTLHWESDNPAPPWAVD